MTAVPNANEHRQLAPAGAGSVQTYAKIAGVLFLLSIVAGGFGEAYVPSRIIVSGDAAATAKNINASDSLFRMRNADYLKAFSADQRNTLALLSLKVYGYGGGI